MNERHVRMNDIVGLAQLAEHERAASLSVFSIRTKLPKFAAY